MKLRIVCHLAAFCQLLHIERKGGQITNDSEFCSLVYHLKCEICASIWMNLSSKIQKVSSVFLV